MRRPRQRSLPLFLGGLVEGRRGMVTPTPKRRHKIQQACRWLARRPRVTGEKLERIIGHIVFVLMTSRPALSILRHAYDFVKDSYAVRQRLWASVAEEFSVIGGLLPLVVADMRLPWHPEIIATDACESGFGETRRPASRGLTKETGRFDERWRYRLLPPDQWAPRRRALAGLDPLLDRETAWPDPASQDQQPLIEREGFLEIPHTIHGHCKGAFSGLVRS